MFFANHALTAALASGSTVSGARRRGPGLLAVTMTKIRCDAAPTCAFVRRFGRAAMAAVLCAALSIGSTFALWEEGAQTS